MVGASVRRSKPDERAALEQLVRLLPRELDNPLCCRQAVRRVPVGVPGFDQPRQPGGIFDTEIHATRAPTGE